MESRSSLERLQFMMHHSMVATSMEIWLGDVPDKNGPPDLKKVLFQKLGNLDWGSNREHSSSGGRQMQTVELEGGASQALFVKLVLKKNHINRQNEYNQVREDLLRYTNTSVKSQWRILVGVSCGHKFPGQIRGSSSGGRRSEKEKGSQGGSGLPHVHRSGYCWGDRVQPRGLNFIVAHLARCFHKANAS